MVDEEKAIGGIEATSQDQEQVDNTTQDEWAGDLKSAEVMAIYEKANKLPEDLRRELRGAVGGYIVLGILAGAVLGTSLALGIGAMSNAIGNYRWTSFIPCIVCTCLVLGGVSGARVGYERTPGGRALRRILDAEYEAAPESGECQQMKDLVFGLLVFMLYIGIPSLVFMLP